VIEFSKENGHQIAFERLGLLKILKLNMINEGNQANRHTRINLLEPIVGSIIKYKLNNRRYQTIKNKIRPTKKVVQSYLILLDINEIAYKLTQVWIFLGVVS
jgi:hypothetical protein